MLRKGIGPMNLGSAKVCGRCQGSICDCDSAPFKQTDAKSDQKEGYSWEKLKTLPSRAYEHYIGPFDTKEERTALGNKVKKAIQTKLGIGGNDEKKKQ